MTWSAEIHSPSMASDVTTVLRRRGLEPRKTGNISNTLYPEDNWFSIIDKHGHFKYQECFPGNFIDHYMNYFGKSLFRKMIRIPLHNDRSFVEIGDLRIVSGKSTDAYLTYLDRMLLVDHNGSLVRLNREIENLGPSLEHYVAELCVRELRGSAEWGVILENLPRSGGDYDVLAWLEPSLVYVESKSASRIANITESELREFLQRSVELAPDLAILLIDTDEKLDEFVESRINRIIFETVDTRSVANRRLRAHLDYPGIYFGFSRIYVTNSRKNILRQLQRCLQHYYAHVKGLALWSKSYLSDESINFTNAPLRKQLK